MAIISLLTDTLSVDTGLDNVVIVGNIKSKLGGASLDTTGFTNPWIRAGHVIIKDDDSGEPKPMPTNAAGTAYAALPDGHSYYGILIQTVKTDKPFAGIMFSGTVNPNVGKVAAHQALGYLDITPILDDVREGFREVDNFIKFIGDND